jgi:hypothetical protein
VLSGSGTYCGNVDLHCFGETGYTYQLQEDLTQAVGALLSGANALLDFPIITSGTYTVVVTDPATGCTAVSNAQEATLIAPDITLATGNSSQTVAISTAITDIQYTTANASSVTVTGLPEGVSGSWTADTYTLSGTPTVAGTFTYTVTTTNSNGCTNATGTGTITVDACTNCANWTTCGFTMISNVASEGSMNWWGADAHCRAKGDGWRLPTVAELDCMCYYGATLPGGRSQANKEMYISSFTMNIGGTLFATARNLNTCSGSLWYGSDIFNVKCVK